jgi:hypothetical protein
MLLYSAGNTIRQKGTSRCGAQFTIFWLINYRCIYHIQLTDTFKLVDQYSFGCAHSTIVLPLQRHMSSPDK